MEWFRQSKCGAPASALALNSAPKSMGRKGNGRERSNKKIADIEEVVNIFVENEIENSSPNNANYQNEKPIRERTLSM